MGSVIYHDLIDKPEWADQCAQWDLTEWPRPQGLDAPEHVHYAAAARSPMGQTPRVIVAAEHGKPIGMISLVDLDDPAYRPWIISIYVVPEKRGQGVFHGLVDIAVTCAKDKIKVPHLYIYSHLPFEKWGWTRITDTPDPSGIHDRMTVYRMAFTSK